MNATERFLTALHESSKVVKIIGPGRWMAQCPAHDDGEPSLSILQGRTGVLVFCHGGCSTKEVVHALGVTEKDLFDDPNGTVYDYLDDSGRLIRRVHRSPEKRFFQTIYDHETRKVLYSPSGKPITPDSTVYVVEGEKDAETLAQIGLIAVSTPQGAKNWNLWDYSPILGAKQIVIVADNDQPGMDRAQGLYAHLRALTSAEVVVKRSAVGKDATDHVVAGYGYMDFLDVDVVTEEDSALEEDIASERRKNFIRTEAKRRDERERIAAAPFVLQPLSLAEVMETSLDYDWIVPGILERGDRFIITGAEGGGKSMMLRQIGVCAASGLHPFNYDHFDPCRVLFIDAENSRRQWARGTQRLVEQVRRRSQVNPLDNVVVCPGVRIDLTVPEGIREVHSLITEHKPDLLVMGPLYKMTPKEITTDNEAAPLLATLDTIRERNVALLMEAHAGHDRENMRPRGSSALLGWPEIGLGLKPREPGKNDLMDLVRWRFDRDERHLPSMVARGEERLGQMPWVDGEEYVV